MQKKSLLTIVCILIVLALPSLAAAAGNALAELDVSPTSIHFVARAGAGEMTLRVSGPGGFMVEQSAADAFELPADAADGTYKWELRQVRQLSDKARARLARNRDQLVLPQGAVQSGGFLVRDGAIQYDEAAVEETLGEFQVDTKAGLEAKDQVILDDLIVDGSICAGQDCVNGESFGFDTLRLKENNLRIKFQDTSNSASFPTNDWQLTANDSSNGGLNKFSIDDIDGARIPFTIEAGARTNALYVEADGDIGIGTANPVTDLHVVTGNTPTLRLEQDGSNGFTAQTWDLAGNEANIFIRDATNGSTLPFRIRPGAPTSALDIASTGNIGINNTNPEDLIHIRNVTSGANPGFRITSPTNTWVTRAHSSGEYRISETSTGITELQLTSAGDMTITGQLTTGGTTCNTGCDLVFAPGYELESIEEHAASMWEQRHLPAVGPTKEEAPFNLTRMTGGMLNELEKAHIYIEQLHKRLSEKEEAFEEVKERLQKLEELLANQD